MLAITAKVKLLKGEVSAARHICKDIIVTLANVNDSTDYRRVIGIFALQAPDWKILNAEKQSMKEILRQVCTGEMPASEAKSKFEYALVELNKLDTWLQVPQK